MSEYLTLLEKLRDMIENEAIGYDIAYEIDLKDKDKRLDLSIYKHFPLIKRIYSKARQYGYSKFPIEGTLLLKISNEITKIKKKNKEEHVYEKYKKKKSKRLILMKTQITLNL